MRNNGFMVRKSGVKDGNYYIDFEGEYIPENIKKLTGIDSITDIYKNNKGEYDEEHDVYYFPSVDNAENAINDLVKLLRKSDHVRKVELTESEIEYIRRALINEDSNVIFTKNKIRESIFDKLNR
ncbi:MAG: hypothetical protein CVU84_02810 [Firmicutes bacterium HGW-Firmicutes-1]|jgi:hypothetical protein|nr:MAG: hypothetical protein CVU84_02810 [Firmicutes bacterium HGW-Firmicutes-1]